MSLHGEAGSVYISAVDFEMNKICQKLREIDAESIFNVDETGGFFKLLPRRTYITECETVKSVRKTEAMNPKDSIAAYVSFNAVGDRVSLEVIRKPKKPKMFPD